MSMASSSSAPPPPSAEEVRDNDFPPRLDDVNRAGDAASPLAVEDAPLTNPSRKATDRPSPRLELLRVCREVEDEQRREKEAKKANKRGRVVSWLLGNLREPRKGLRKMPSIEQVLSDGSR
jgi:hypothetical protein